MANPAVARDEIVKFRKFGVAGTPPPEPPGPWTCVTSPPGSRLLVLPRSSYLHFAIAWRAILFAFQGTPWRRLTVSGAHTNARAQHSLRALGVGATAISPLPV